MYCTVYIPHGDGAYTRSFNSSNYDSYAATLRAAAEDRNKALYELNSGKAIGKSSALTVGEIWALWPSSVPQAYSTYKAYGYIYRNYIQDKYEDLPITEITEYDVQQTVNDVARNRNSRNAKYGLTFWKYMFRIAHKMQIRYYIDFDLIDMPKTAAPPTKHKSTVTDADLELICNQLSNHSGAASRQYDYRLIAHALKIMRHTGLRPAEVYAIRREDVGETELHVTGSVGETAQNVRSRKQTKTPTSVRTIPLNYIARSELDAVLDMSDNELIFTRHNGQIMNTSKAASWISAVSKELGIDFRSYDCRHQFATDLDLHNVSDRTRMELMGHSRLDTTNGYARSNDSAKQDAVNSLVKKEEKRRTNRKKKA